MQKKDDLNEMILNLQVIFIFTLSIDLEIKDKCVVDVDDYTENTDLGREIYYLIEDTIFKTLESPDPNDHVALYKTTLVDDIKGMVKEYDKRKLH
jgi:hypothetical protein